ncbi:3-phosphoshikimate 1-carboxyvinyltransferase [Fictibacillus fluitans]|uniref:3-phosphoshikimate 1-carboxyvinyltransferase n=1 Tax=Fictibacillus fluitans TaxID=3058422 RepID=A0ABT8HQV7_9BACL|nr:3-phosphoshikimate 1-carboxyvinyltransferase [Fictibacillus sp. NE201]MDN4523152.1 3-phosphoshikimate 1-carboxyvinyltransferase [Fictibacillus sp. NE201]
MLKTLRAVSGLQGSLRVPGDKSISHRAVMFGSIAEGTTTVNGFLPGDDCLSTIDCFRKMGVSIEQSDDTVKIEGKGLDGLTEPSEILDVGNSGTTIRLMLGILANTPFHACLIGDASIAKRPMKRVTAPLRERGVAIDGREDGNFVPLSIRGGNTQTYHYNSPVASAQVKSAVLLSGLKAEGTTSVTEPYTSRDHTERMLRAFGCEVQVSGKTASLKGGQSLKGTHIEVPGDISSAAFFLVAGAIIPNSEITLKKVGMNSTRTGIIDVLQQMGADLTISAVEGEDSEPYADITVRTSELKGIEIGGEIIPRLIDEIPIIALAATQASGTTVIKDAAELKVKETNRIDTVVNELKKFGADITATADGMIIKKTDRLQGAETHSHGDHRIGMMLAIAACLSEGETSLSDSQAVTVSYPNFFEQLEQLQKENIGV